MTQDERNAIVAIFSNIIISGYVIFHILSRYRAGDFSGADGIQLWAQSISWFVLLSIVVNIVAAIVFAILHAIATRDPDPSSLVDERDDKIRARGHTVIMAVASTGLILAIALLAFGKTAFIALNIILASFALADLLGNIVRVALYRRGY